MTQAGGNACNSSCQQTHAVFPASEYNSLLAAEVELPSSRCDNSITATTVTVGEVASIYLMTSLNSNDRGHFRSLSLSDYKTVRETCITKKLSRKPTGVPGDGSQ